MVGASAPAVETEGGGSPWQHPLHLNNDAQRPAHVKTPMTSNSTALCSPAVTLLPADVSAEHSTNKKVGHSFSEASMNNPATHFGLDCHCRVECVPPHVHMSSKGVKLDS